MASSSAISWTDATFNPWIGCTKVGPGCDNCYAERDFDIRKGRVKWGTGNARSRTSAANWKLPERWNRATFYECGGCGWRGDKPDTVGGSITNGMPSCPACDSMDLSDARRRVFCASLADVFDNEVDREWRADLFRLIESTPNLDWLLLTKRIGNVRRMIPHDMTMPKNVWLGATIVNQEEADRDIQKLLRVPAAVRFLSIEPMLGAIDLHGLWSAQVGHKAVGGPIPPGFYANLHWIICGGESGPKARPMHPDWVRSLRDQAQAAGVAFHFKQWGEWGPAPRMIGEPGKTLYSVGSVKHTIMQDGSTMARVGKKSAGRQLDGREWNEFTAAS